MSCQSNTKASNGKIIAHKFPLDEPLVKTLKLLAVYSPLFFVEWTASILVRFWKMMKTQRSGVFFLFCFFASSVYLSVELKRQAASLESAQAELNHLQTQLAKATAEMENIKAVATVSESTKQEAIDQVKQQWQEEVASLQAIMKGKRALKSTSGSGLAHVELRRRKISSEP